MLILKKSSIYSIVISWALAGFGSILAFSETYDYHRHFAAYQSFEFSFSYIQATYREGYFFYLIGDIFKRNGLSFGWFGFFLYLTSFFILHRYTLSRLSLSWGEKSIVVYACLLLSFPYISLYSGMRYVFSIVLVGYVVSLNSFRVVPFFGLIPVMLHSGSIFALIGSSAGRIFLTVSVLLIFFSVYFYGIDYGLDRAVYLFDEYFGRNRSSQRSVIFDFLYRVQIVVPALMLYGVRRRVWGGNFKFYNLLFLAIFIVLINNYVLLDRAIIAYWVGLWFFASELLLLTRGYALVWVFLICCLKFILLVQANFDGVGFRW